MKIVYDSSFQSLVKACMLKEVKGYEPVREALGDCLKAADYDLRTLLVEWDWLYGTPRNISGLEGALSLALRHRFCTPDLLFTVIKQALSHGIDYVLTRRSYEARRFCNYVLSVREELRTAKFNIHFTHYGNFLLGKYLFNHDISDLLVDFYQKRFPEKKVVILNAEREVPSGIAMPVPVPAGNSIPMSAPPVPPSLTLNAFM